MIQLQNVTKQYDDSAVALRNLSLHMKPGEFVSVVGQSGAGKSTIVRLIMAEEPVSRGRIIVGGWDITNIKRREIPVLRRQIGVIFQDYKLLRKKTVYENIAFALEVCGESRQHIKKYVPQLLKIVGLEDRWSRFPDQLSGGEQQRVSIARALVHRPKLLLADEPTGNLDSLNAQDIIEVLRKINELGTTIMLVTHNRDIVNSLKRRVVTLDHGAIISDQSVGRYIL